MPGNAPRPALNRGMLHTQRSAPQASSWTQLFYSDSPTCDQSSVTPPPAPHSPWTLRHVPVSERSFRHVCHVYCGELQQTGVKTASFGATRRSPTHPTPVVLLSPQMGLRRGARLCARQPPIVPSRPTPLPLPTHLVSWRAFLASPKVPPAGTRQGGGGGGAVIICGGAGRPGSFPPITIATNPLRLCSKPR